MKKSILVMTMVLCLSAGAVLPVYAAGTAVSDSVNGQKLDDLNQTTKMVDARLVEILSVINQNVQQGSCWLDGKSWSQGAVTTNQGHKVECGKNVNNWPQWQRLK